MARPATYTSAKDLLRALGELPDLAREHIVDSLRESAGELAVDAARRARAVQGVAALVAPAIVVMDDDDGAVVTVRGERSIGPGPSRTVADVFWGAERGGQHRPETMQFLPYRPEGYFMGPALDEAEDAIVDRGGEALEDALFDIPRPR